MSKKDKNIDKHKLNTEEIVNKINSSLGPGSAKVLTVKELPEGRYQLEMQVAETNVLELLGEANKIKSRVKVINRNPLFNALKNNTDLDSLQSRLDSARLKGAQKMVERLEKEGKDSNAIEKELARLDTRYRDILGGSYLDLREKGAEETEALKLYKRSDDEYYKTGIYGTHLDLLSNFAATGFYNEINNPEIKEFYDSWVKDTQFVSLVTKIFHDLFKYSVSYILKSTGSYEPHLDGVSSIPGKEPSGTTKPGKKAKLANAIASEIRKKHPGFVLDYDEFSKRYSKGYGATSSFPVAYTLLDPKYIKVEGSGFFGGTTVTITRQGLNPLKKTLEKIKQDSKSVSNSVKDSIKLLPSGMRKAAEDGTDYIFQESELSIIFLRKRDTEIYAKPRGSRAFDAFDYKDELKKADYATVDGIYNYILKITVGDKDFPVTDDQVLADLAEAFNTPQKAFSIVWNHTLDIEKITTNEVGAILGKQKYEPVDEEIGAALGFAKALIDGKGLSADGGVLITKGLKSEINAARLKVTDWVYTEYREIAKAAGFSAYPVVRWKESVINTDSDSVTRASYMQMLDRKAISVQSYMREMDFDYDTEVQRMKEEFPLIQQDILRAGSPYQATIGGTTPASPVSGDQGRPKGQPTTEKKPDNPVQSVKDKTKVKTPSQASNEEDLWVDEVIAVLQKSNPEIREKIILGLSHNASSDPEVEEIASLEQERPELLKVPLDKLLE